MQRHPALQAAALAGSCQITKRCKLFLCLFSSWLAPVYAYAPV